MSEVSNRLYVGQHKYNQVFYEYYEYTTTLHNVCFMPPSSGDITGREWPPAGNVMKSASNKGSFTNKKAPKLGKGHKFTKYVY